MSEKISTTLKDVSIVKKDGTLEEFNINKVINAVSKSSERVLNKLTQEDINMLCNNVVEEIKNIETSKINVEIIHNVVESVLEKINSDVAKSYKDYRNYKKDFVHMLDKVYKESQRIMYLGDKSNANADSALVTTKRSLMFNSLSTELYKNFFLSKEELSAIKEGYLYIHDIGSRLLTSNCCIANIEAILKDGFEMANVWYNEPKSLDVAFGVIADITLSASGCQYGGFSLGEVDKLLEPYAIKSYDNLLNKYIELGVEKKLAEKQKKLSTYF